MELAKLLRIFVGESDRIKHQPLYEVIVAAAKRNGLAGATVWRGILSYGTGSQIHTYKILELSHNLPMTIEIIDSEEKIGGFLPLLTALIDEAGGGGLVTLEKVERMVIQPHHVSQKH